MALFQPVEAVGIKFVRYMVRGLIILLILLLHLRLAVSQATPQFEEIVVFVRVHGVGGFNMDAIYEHGTGRLFLPVQGLFSALRIKYEFSADQKVISGFIISEENSYIIDYSQRSIEFNERSVTIQEGEILKTDLGLFLHTALFGPVFGLYASFNFRALSVEIKTALDLPAIREIRLAQMRRNIDQLRGEVEADTAILRNYNLFRYGKVDWAFNSTQYSRGKHNSRANIGFGAELFGGETNIILDYSNLFGFDSRNQHYSWRWANNEVDLVRQVLVGRIAPHSIASVFDPVIGVVATNAPTTYRRAFGSYTISDFTEPGWTVELYINNVLVDYQVADASGFYSFDAPLVYGTSQLKLQFYGPFGEERIKQKFLNIPFHFLPGGEVEYNISGGLVQDGEYSRFGNASANVGVNRFLTVGGGLEHLSSIETATEIPFISASVRPFRNLIIAGEYAHRVRSKAHLSLRFPSNLMFEVDFTRYVPGQQAIWFDHLEERRFLLSTPLNLLFLRGFTQLALHQTVFDRFTHNRADWTYSVHIRRFNANITTSANWIDARMPYLHSNLTFGLHLGRGITLRAKSMIGLTPRNIKMVRAELQKRVARTGYLSISAEEHLMMNKRSFDVKFRWNLPFAQTNLAGRTTGGEFTATQGASGSFAFGSGKGYLHTENRSSVGKGGLSIAPFLDINHNRIFDENEPAVTGLRIRVSGGRILRDLNDSIVRVVDLEPYTNYMVEIEESGLQQIAWRVENKRLRVYVDPNQFKKLYIPVIPVGEASGWVYFLEYEVRRPQGRILINIYDKYGQRVARKMTEPDGGFTYLGLPPGDFFAAVDSVQINRLGFSSTPQNIQFTVLPISDGDIVDGLEFTLKRLEVAYAEKLPELVQPDPIIAEPVIDLPTAYFVQAGAFRYDKNATALADKLWQLLKIQAHIAYEEGLFKVRTGGFETHRQAQAISKALDTQRLPNYIIIKPTEEVLSGYFVQAGAFKNEKNAITLVKQISQLQKVQVRISFEDGYYKVRSGGFKTREEAIRLSHEFQARGINTYIVVR